MGDVEASVLVVLFSRSVTSSTSPFPAAPSEIGIRFHLSNNVVRRCSPRELSSQDQVKLLKPELVGSSGRRVGEPTMNPFTSLRFAVVVSNIFVVLLVVLVVVLLVVLLLVVVEVVLLVVLDGVLLVVLGVVLRVGLVLSIDIGK